MYFVVVNIGMYYRLFEFVPRFYTSGLHHAEKIFMPIFFSFLFVCYYVSVSFLLFT